MMIVARVLGGRAQAVMIGSVMWGGDDSGGGKMERMMEEVAVRRRGQGTASDADTDDLLLSGVEFVADNEPYDLGQRRNNNSQGNPAMRNSLCHLMLNACTKEIKLQITTYWSHSAKHCDL
ncbi:unnamed protein product [Toxocara canis]|uniref:LSDAT_euk domain-containing protein n=1 Tax=Toxocara canis TaxID=6265 RepID=A0A183U484_TOXCA|nr:unnamed protein product [Toxocara canis]